MVIHIDNQRRPGRVKLRAVEATPVDAVALQKNERFYGRKMLRDAICAGEKVKVRRNRIHEDYSSFLPKCLKQMHHRKRGANSVTVRANVRADGEYIMHSEEMKQR